MPAFFVNPEGTALDPRIRGLLSDIDGWLADPAAIFTAHLMHVQTHRQVDGGVLELGVYRGKYLALLYLCSAEAQRPVLGVDIFAGVANTSHNQHAMEAVKRTILRATADLVEQMLKNFRNQRALHAVEHNVSQASGDIDRLRLMVADTLTLEPTALRDPLGGAAAFISIDGGHEAVHLDNDLGLAAELIARGGIVAVDDAFNHSTPGAIEGTCRFFEHHNNKRLVAFAHCYNKLFLCDPGDHAEWLREVKRFVAEHPRMDFCQRTAQRMHENASGGFVPRFFGWEIVPFL